jgi:hypothetical protein
MWFSSRASHPNLENFNPEFSLATFMFCFRVVSVFSACDRFFDVLAVGVDVVVVADEPAQIVVGSLVLVKRLVASVG